jgi:hypothetical protein
MENFIIAISVILFCFWLVRSWIRLRYLENWQMYRFRNAKAIHDAEIAMEALNYSCKAAAQAGEALRDALIASRKHMDTDPKATDETIEPK